MHTVALIVVATAAAANPAHTSSATPPDAALRSAASDHEPLRWDNSPAPRLREQPRADRLTSPSRNAPPADRMATGAGVRTAEYTSDARRPGGTTGHVQPTQFVQQLTPISDNRVPPPAATETATDNSAGHYIPPSLSATNESETSSSTTYQAPSDSRSPRDRMPDAARFPRDPRRPPSQDPAPPSTVASPWEFESSPQSTTSAPADDPAFDTAGVPSDQQYVIPEFNSPNSDFESNNRDTIISRQRMTAHVANAPVTGTARNRTAATEASHPTLTPAATGGAATAPTAETPAPDIAQSIDPYGAARRTDSSNNAAAPRTANAPTGGTYFFVLLALFASLGMNLYLGWIAWDTYNRYQELVSDMRHSATRRDRADRDGAEQREFTPRRNRRLVEAY